ncbi:MAG TPA: hypothetical protein VI318_08580, partial [Baekduia sp.]
MHRPHLTGRRAAAGGLAATALLTGCAMATAAHPVSQPAATTTTDCPAPAGQTLAGVARRIYDQASGGP